MLYWLALAHSDYAAHNVLLVLAAGFIAIRLYTWRTSCPVATLAR
jgi:hypothetical protein